MKKIMFLITATLITSLSIFAQGTTHIAETFQVLSKNLIMQAENKDEQALHSLISTLQTGWNNKSGAIFSSVFADVHDYIVVNGMYFSNFTKKGNEAAHQGLFDGVYKNYNIKLVVDKITFFRADLAQVIVIGAGYNKTDPIPENPNTIMTILAEKKNDTWKIISFHNHQLDDDIKQRSPMPINVMYASWYKK